jgi:hypothetical protein
VYTSSIRFCLNRIQGKYWLNKRHLFRDNKERDGLSSQYKLGRIFPSLPCENTICHVEEGLQLLVQSFFEKDILSMKK